MAVGEAEVKVTGVVEVKQLAGCSHLIKLRDIPCS